jgi:hypothetical protein
MCFSTPKVATPNITMPAIPKAVAPPTQRDGNLDALDARRRRLQGATSADATGGLGDTSVAPTTKTTLGG